MGLDQSIAEGTGIKETAKNALAETGKLPQASARTTQRLGAKGGIEGLEFLGPMGKAFEQLMEGGDLAAAGNGKGGNPLQMLQNLVNFVKDICEGKAPDITKAFDIKGQPALARDMSNEPGSPKPANEPGMDRTPGMKPSGPGAAA